MGGAVDYFAILMLPVAVSVPLPAAALFAFGLWWVFCIM